MTGKRGRMEGPDRRREAKPLRADLGEHLPSIKQYTVAAYANLCVSCVDSVYVCAYSVDNIVDEVQ